MRVTKGFGIGAPLLWLVLFNTAGVFTWGYGPLTFCMFLGAATLMVVVGLGRQAEVTRAGVTRAGVTRAGVLPLILGMLALGLLAFHAVVLVRELRAPHGSHAVDIGINTFAAGELLLQGDNPYAGNAQRWHRVMPAAHVSVQDGRVRMFGWE